MRIIHIIDSFKMGGVEVGVLNLLLNNDNYRILAVNGCNQEFLYNVPKGVRDRIIIRNNLFLAFIYLCKYKPGMIVSSLWRAHLISIIFSFFFRSVVRIHFVHSARFAHLFDRMITMLSFKFTNYVIFDSDRTKAWSSDYLKKKEVFQYVVPMNITFSTDKKVFLSKEMKFIYTGRINRIKRIDKAIDFICELRSQGYRAFFDIYGPDSGDSDYIKSHISSNSANEFVKIYDSISPFQIEEKMREYNFYLQTSKAEGMAISVFQSIINGLLPIVTPVGDIQNYAIDMKNAIFFDIDNVTDTVAKFIFSYKSDFQSFDIGFVDLSKYPPFSDRFFYCLNDIERKL